MLDAAIVALDHRFDPAARLPRRTRQPAGEKHVVLAFEALQIGGQELKVFLDICLFGHADAIEDRPFASGDQEPHQRQPKFSGVRQRPIVDEDVAGVQTSDDLEQGSQAQRIGRIEARAMAASSAFSDLAVLG